MRILLDIPRPVRMRSSECRTRKPRRMASRVWVVLGEEDRRTEEGTRRARRRVTGGEGAGRARGMDDRGSGTEQGCKGTPGNRRHHIQVMTGKRVVTAERNVRGARAAENLPALAAAMPANRVHAILINPRPPPLPLPAYSTGKFSAERYSNGRV